MRVEKKTGNLGCFVCPLPVFFSLNHQPFLATLPYITKTQFDNYYNINADILRIITAILKTARNNL